MKCITCENEALTDSDSCGPCERKELSKIGGLLWLPAFGLVAGLIMYLVSITNIVNVLGLIRQNAPQIMPLIIFELVGQIILAMLGAWTIFLFFKRRRRTIPTYITLLLLIAAYRLADTWIAIEHFGIGPHITNYGQIMPAIVGALIWVPYFLRSVRVKRTFVH
ncbi:MAG TPA: DUF2569 domain-containing protein [Buttiauxella sp.]|jgi:hypothetical protein